MKIIPFDIALREQIQSEENGYKGRYKVQTRVGNDVRIICWDKIDKRDKPYPIAGLRTVDDTEFIATWTKDGKFSTDVEYGINDLVLVDTWEPKFNIGDRVRYKNSNEVYRIADMLECHYHGVLLSDESSRLISFKDDDRLELVPKEPELTGFEEQLANFLYKSIGVVCMDGMETLAKEFAPKLLELAKKEIIEKLKEK